MLRRKSCRISVLLAHNHSRTNGIAPVVRTQSRSPTARLEEIDVTPDKDKALVQDCPNLYQERHKPMSETCMCWGFQCGDGWEPLIRELSIKLEALIVAIPEAERGKYRTVQVKEKFATLRFDMRERTDEMRALINEAEEKSAVTCDTCGQTGKRRGGSWLRTLCDTCHEKRQ
jgi:hypothetical protein